MFSLQDLLGPAAGGEAQDEIAQNVGADRSAVQTAIAAALPALINGLANNAADPRGAESLNNALDEDHDGSILENLGGLAGSIFGGSAPPSVPPKSADGEGILEHMLGDDRDRVAQDVSERTGLGTGQVIQILMYLAPLVMGYLGRQKREQSVGADGLGGLLGGLLGGGGQQSSGNAAIDMASRYLDKDGDGSVVDDLGSMASDYLNRK